MLSATNTFDGKMHFLSMTIKGTLAQDYLTLAKKGLRYFIVGMNGSALGCC
jgi:hypothetical protein